MQNTVIGVYDNHSQAQAALNELMASGYLQSNIAMSPAQESHTARTQALAAQEEGQGFSLGRFFQSLFGGEEAGHAHHDFYREAVRRGSYLVTVQTDDDAGRDQACAILERYDPVDIDERSSHWRTRGWSTHDRQAAAYTDEEVLQERGVTRSPDPAAASLQQRVRVYGVDPALANTPNTEAATGMDNDAYRSHWQSAYASQGGRYEDFEPAYRFGSAQRQNEIYRDRHWNDIEPELRQSWEGQHAHTPWEKAREAVRHAWERIPG